MGLRHRLTHSLSAKISAAFAVVLALHASIAILAHLGLEKAQEDTARLDQGRKLALRMIAIERRIGSLQRDVLGFTHSGHRSLIGRVHRSTRAVVEDLEAAHRQVAREGEREEIEAMLAAVARYSEQFDLAVIDRQMRKEIVDEGMLELSRRGATLFESLLDPARALIRDEDVPRVARTQQRFVEAEAGARRYVHELDHSSIRFATERLERCREGLDGLQADGREDLEEVLVGGRQLLDEYEGMLIRLVQTTRGYLHLVKVVMAGEEAEFLRASSRLREGYTAELDHLNSTISADQRSFQIISAVISAVTILIGLLASNTITRVVVKPLRRITGTLTRLARGEEAASIPDRHRVDDIGAMAKAAAVFHDRNRETIRVLAEIRALAEEHEGTIADLEATNRELDNFAHIASHDLKAPLRGMGLLATWVEEDSGDQLTEQSRAHLVTLRKRVGRMTRLLDDLLAYAKAGRANAEVDRVDVLECAREAVGLSGIPEGFEVALRGDEVCVEAPRVALVQVLQNLISNAVKHHHRPDGRIEVEVSAVADGVEVVVSDDGPGIPEEHHERIFAPFETLKSRDELDASGVGLALVRKVLERYQGTITVSSEVGEGACFRMTWPEGSSATDADLREERRLQGVPAERGGGLIRV